MQFRRHQDIVAFKNAGQAPVAFHARNLEVAQISEELWSEMSASTAIATSEAHQDLENWNRETNPDVKSGKIEFGIRSLTINVTQICNLHCTYCAAGGDGSFNDPVQKISVEKTLPQLQFFLARVKDGSKFHITFLGGEPLLFPEGMKLIADYVDQKITGRGIRATYTVVTNGTLLTQTKVLDLLARLKANITISIDGPAEINDIYRIGKNKKGSTAQTQAGIEALLARKGEMGNIGLSGVFGRQNMEIEKAYAFYSAFDVDWFEFNYEYGEKDENSHQLYMLKMTELAERAYARGGEQELRRIRVFDHYFHSLDSQQQVENYCGAGKSFLMVDARNELYTCPWVVGRSAEKVAVSGDPTTLAVAGYQEPLIEKHGCGNCWARFMCGGGCMFINQLKTGDKHRKDLQFCERTKHLISLALLYYQRSRA